MHEAFWNGLFDTRWEGAPLGQDAIRLVLRLRRRGYAERTCRDYGHAVIHLGRVLHDELEGVDRTPDEAVVSNFLDHHLPACRCYRQPPGRGRDHVRRGLAHLLVMLREEGVLPPVARDEPPYHALIQSYSRFLLHDRGLAETTVTNYRRYLRDFLASRGDAVSPEQLVQLGADDLLAFSRRRGARLGYTAWNHRGRLAVGFLPLVGSAGPWGRALGGRGAATTALSPRRRAVRAVVGPGPAPARGARSARALWPAQLRHAPADRHLRAARL